MLSYCVTNKSRLKPNFEPRHSFALKFQRLQGFECVLHRYFIFFHNQAEIDPSNRYFKKIKIGLEIVIQSYRYKVILYYI